MNERHKKPYFQLMVEASPIALMSADISGKILYLNSYAEELFQYKKNELTGKDVGILFPERYRAEYAGFRKNFSTEPVIRQMGKERDWFAQKKDGKEFPVEIELNSIDTGEEPFVLISAVDVTEREKANEQFRLIVESVPNSILLIDSSGHIVMINRQTEILFGYERDELIGKSMEILVPERLRASHSALRLTFYVRPEVRPMGTGRDLFGAKKDGTEIPIEIGLNPIEKGGARFVLVSIIDITERKKNEEAIRLYTKRIEDKNRELEQFTFIASHDLREPLNSINSLIELLIENESDKLNEVALEQLDFISRSSNRMKELVKGLLDYACLGKKSEFTKIDFNEIVKQVVNDLEMSVKDSGAEIKMSRLPVFNAMEIEMRLLFQNLISNAIKYRNVDCTPEIEVSAKRVKGGWQFAVKDNGIGIPSNQKEKIFIIFQRLHGRDEYDGIGIGLSHCRKIVELHDGRIWVDSEPGKGSTFCFFIPLK